MSSWEVETNPVVGRVNDDGDVVGLLNAKRLLEDIPNKVRDILGIMVDVHLKKSKGFEFLFSALGSTTQETTQEISPITGQVAGQVTVQVITFFKTRQCDMSRNEVTDKLVSKVCKDWYGLLPKLMNGELRGA